MKILYVTTVSLTLNTFLIPHIKFLVEQGYEVKIASNIDRELSEQFINMGVKHIKIDFSRNPFNLNNLKALKQIKMLQEKENFDVIHVHTPIASFITRAALRKKYIKVIYTAHGFHFYKGAPIINWALYYPLEKIAANWTDILVTINTEDLEMAKKFRYRSGREPQLMHGVGIDPNMYLLDNFDRNEYRKNFGLEKEDFVLLILAELNKNKNHIQIIKAMSILKKRYSNIKVLCAGKGPLEESLKMQVDKLGVSNSVKFIGFRSDVKELLNSCDCVGLFSKREGLGKCILEGMVLGKPIIATNTRGAKEIVENNKNGYLVDIGDYKKTAEYIENIYLDENKRKRFSIYSLEKVKMYYLENVLKEVSEYY